jgi:type VI secretion system secreted protein VgrG
MTGTNTEHGGSPLPEADFAYSGHGAEGFRVTDVYVNEALSEVYQCRVSLAAAMTPAQPQAMLGQPCAIEITRNGEHGRRVCGIVQSVEDVGSDGVAYHLRLTIVPALWTLSQRSNYRVFQDVTALEVVRLVLKDAGLYQGEGARREDVTAGAYAQREYCSQFGETDLEFVVRLLAEEGLCFYFLHAGEAETLVIADGATPAVWNELPTMDGLSVAVAGTNMALAPVETIYQFQAVHELKPSGVTQRDYNFTAPRATPDVTRTHPRGATPRVLYEYPGHWTLGDYDPGTHAYRKHDGTRRTQVRSEALTMNALALHGLSNVTTLAPGMIFNIQGHDRADHDGSYLVIAVEHHAHAPDGGIGGHGAAGDRYSNNFTAVPVAVPFRPAYVARPRAPGPQTARVMPRPGTTEEISVDVHGRVLVQFHWDRPEQRAPTQKPKQSSCWIRVAQAWAGSRFGALFIPRVDMEVVVTYVDGDPDRPLITGCVYNADHMPPNTLPDDPTKSTIRTHSTPGGNGYNELTFKDAAGHEKIFMRAQHDHEVIVRNDESVAVGRDQSVHVNHDRTVTVERNEVVIVKNDQNTAIHHHGIIQANDSFTIQVGNSKIEVFPDRIVLTSPTIQVHGSTKVEIIGGLVDINP